MTKLLFILPQEKDRELAQQIFREHNWAGRLNKTENPEEFTASFIVSIEPEQYISALREADVIIVRGATANNVRNLVPEASVTEIPFSANDIIPTIMQIVQENGHVAIGLIGAYNMVYNAAEISEFLKIDLRQYVSEVNVPDVISHMVERARADGCKVILGGIDTCACARMLGIPAYDFPIGQGSLWQAISIAKHEALNRNRDRAKAFQFQTVLNHIHEGVVAVDYNGDIITVNSAAEKILGISQASSIGRPASTVLGGTNMRIVLDEEKELFDRLIQDKQGSLNINKIRMILHGNFLGYVYTLQSTADMQETQADIRRQANSRGHVAKYSFANIIGDSLPLRRTVEMAKLYAKAEADILIIGDSGTGKELFAQSIHRASARSLGPFVAVNCAALPKSLIESELFGYSEGSFTGASKGGKSGMFELAHKGTIFLDEVSELPLEFQGQLLRIFQEREITRIGSGKVTPVDVRIICASNRSLTDMIERGAFRRDLYYRLSVLNLHIPALKERPEDIIALIDYYLSIFAVRYQKLIPVISSEATKFLLRQEWPGNVREVRNVCERLLILNDSNVITEEDVRSALQIRGRTTDLEQMLANQEKELLLALLKKHHGSKALVAEELGISRTTLWRKLKVLNVSSS